MAIAFKPTRGLNVFTFQYVNSQCQHDSLLHKLGGASAIKKQAFHSLRLAQVFLKLAAKLHLFTETAKFLTDYFDFRFSYILCIYFFQSDVHVFILCPAKIMPSIRG